MPTTAQADISRLIDQFTNDLTTLVRRNTLEEVLASLQGDINGAVRRGPGRPMGSGKKRGRPVGSKNKPKAGKRGRRTSADLEAMQADLLTHVKANPGQRGEQIAAALGTDVGTMRGPMKGLIAGGQVRTEGQRRGMTYFAGAGKAKAAKKAGKKKARRGGRRKKAAAKAA
jgi:hypothetical protein